MQQKIIDEIKKLVNGGSSYLKYENMQYLIISIQ